MLTSNEIDLYVHAGVFHADDVFSAAFLRLYGLTVTVHRVNEVTPDMLVQAAAGTAVIADIGLEYDPDRNLFDHHQGDSPVRSGGAPYAAFGLLARTFWKDEWEWKELFDSEFIEPLDQCDNNGGYNPVSKMIKHFAPTWEEDTTMDEAFDQAAEFALGILERDFRQRKAKLESRYVLEEEAAMAQNGVIVLERYIPFDGILDGTCGCKAVVYPSARGGYDCRILYQFAGSRTLVGRFKKIRPGVGGCMFIHSSGFLASFETQEQAIEAAKHIG